MPSSAKGGSRDRIMVDLRQLLYCAEEIAFAEIDAILPQECVRHRHVKEEVRQYEIG